MKKTIILLANTIITGFVPVLSDCSYKAVIIDAYIDLIHHNQHVLTSDQELNSMLSFKETPQQWPRTAQLLFNQQVQVIKERNDYVLIRLDNCLVDKKIPLQGWVRKKSVKGLNTLGKNLYSIPSHTNSLVLVEPWADEVSKRIYSAGTRFVRDTTQDIDPDFYGVFIYEPQHNNVVRSLVPHYAMIIEHTRSIEQQKELFIITLKKWCLYHLPIRYLYGGMSFTSLQPLTPVVQQCFYNGAERQCFIALEPQVEPLSGFDCSGIIFRAAQIAGMPYNLRNTTAIKNTLQPLTEQYCLEVGDLVCTQGHVMVVACLQPALLIEAVGYQSGYGRVHMIELHKKFKDIHTWHDLLMCFFEHKVPIQLYADGSEDPHNYPISFLRLSSLWSDAADDQCC